MNNAKMWLVVKPTVGVPLFLGAVAVGSFAVHVAVLSNTTWVSDFLSGKELGSSMAQVLPAAQDKTAIASMSNGDRITVTLPDGRVAVARIEETSTELASAMLFQPE